MGSKILLASLSSCLLFAPPPARNAVFDVVVSQFDELAGANRYVPGETGGTFGAGNWVDLAAGFVPPHSGTDAFLSFWGGPGPNITDIGLIKVLGGVVQPCRYEVSFYITKYLGGQPLEFADFSTLRIGGAAGKVTWTSTPTPTTDGTWVKWTGTYVPHPADLGKPFRFEAIFDLDVGHSLGFDGPVVALPRL